MITCPNIYFNVLWQLLNARYIYITGNIKNDYREFSFARMKSTKSRHFLFSTWIASHIRTSGCSAPVDSIVTEKYPLVNLGMANKKRKLTNEMLSNSVENDVVFKFRMPQNLATRVILSTLSYFCGLNTYIKYWLALPSFSLTNISLTGYHFHPLIQWRLQGNTSSVFPLHLRQISSSELFLAASDKMQ